MHSPKHYRLTHDRTPTPIRIRRSTPLLLAAHAGHMEAVELLLRSPGVCTRRHLNYLRRNGTSLLWCVLLGSRGMSVVGTGCWS